ncbi:mucin-5B-like [Megalobrama amblycephala]|uniref:mucin-5B-like n=1 Tax=Megalobrama amblycephala TaxID=75352 RepID=UPI0020147DE6|nr:mucin-5B-like [Megalobrama amblycephala]
MKRDPTGGSKDSQEHAHNKGSFREYIELFPSGRIAIALKEEQYAEKAPHHAAATQLTPPTQHAAATQLTPPTQHAAATQLTPATQITPTTQHTATTHTSTTSLRSLLVTRLPNQKSLTKTVERLVSPHKATPSLAQARAKPSATLTRPTASIEGATGPSATLTRPTASIEGATGPSATLTRPTASIEGATGPSATLTRPTASIEGATGPSATLTRPTASIEGATGPSATLTLPTEIDDSTLLAEATVFEETYVASRRVCLPAGWIHTLPEMDQRWISKALFRWTAQGHPELIFSRVDKLWWYPPQVPLKTSNSPFLENYFGHPLLLWMP